MNPLLIIALPLLSLSAFVRACTFTAAPVVPPSPLLSLPPLLGIIASSDPQQLITDLRTPTPLTFTNTVTGVTGCATDPQTLTAWYTAYVNGVGYTALPTSAIFNVDGQDVYEFFTFPGLTVTALTPGETLSVVRIPVV
jgi:hypothetical protein